MPALAAQKRRQPIIEVASERASEKSGRPSSGHHAAAIARAGVRSRAAVAPRQRIQTQLAHGGQHRRHRVLGCAGTLRRSSTIAAKRCSSNASPPREAFQLPRGSREALGKLAFQPLPHRTARPKIRLSRSSIAQFDNDQATVRRTARFRREPCAATVGELVAARIVGPDARCDRETRESTGRRPKSRQSLLAPIVPRSQRGVAMHRPPAQSRRAQRRRHRVRGRRCGRARATLRAQRSECGSYRHCVHRSPRSGLRASIKAAIDRRRANVVPAARATRQRQVVGARRTQSRWRPKSVMRASVLRVRRDRSAIRARAPAHPRAADPASADRSIPMRPIPARVAQVRPGRFPVCVRLLESAALRPQSIHHPGPSRPARPAR